MSGCTGCNRKHPVNRRLLYYGDYSTPKVNIEFRKPASENCVELDRMIKDKAYVN